MVLRNAAVTPPVTLVSRSSHSERLETRDKRLEGDVGLTTFGHGGAVAIEDATNEGAVRKARSPRKTRVPSRAASEEVGAKRTGSSPARARKTTRGGGRGRTTFAAANAALRRSSGEVRQDEDAGKTMSVIPRVLTNKVNAQDGGITWYYSSPLNDRVSTRIAGRRFAALLGRGHDYDELITALSEWGSGCDLTGVPHTPLGFTDTVARSFIATIRERQRDERRIDESVTRRNAYERGEPLSVRPDRPLHRMAFDLSAFGVSS